MAEQTERVLRDIAVEREHQIANGWTPEHDDTHNTHTLVQLAERRARMPGAEVGAEVGYYDRHRLVQSAALLVAAVEAMDRRDAEDRA